jgi:hypothetical protein
MDTLIATSGEASGFLRCVAEQHSRFVSENRKR